MAEKTTTELIEAETERRRQLRELERENLSLTLQLASLDHEQRIDDEVQRLTRQNQSMRAAIARKSDGK